LACSSLRGWPVISSFRYTIRSPPKSFVSSSRMRTDSWWPPEAWPPLLGGRDAWGSLGGDDRAGADTLAKNTCKATILLPMRPAEFVESSA